MWKTPETVYSGSGSDDAQRAPTDLKRPNELECQVPGCENDIVGCKDIHVRCRVCDMHFRAPISLILGVEQRFCQLCGKFQLLSEFDGRKVSCREKLALHNKRRRDNRTKRRLAKGPNPNSSADELQRHGSPASPVSPPLMAHRRSNGVLQLLAPRMGPVDSLDAAPANMFGNDHRLTAPNAHHPNGMPERGSDKRARFDLDSGPVPWDRQFHSCPTGPADLRLVESCRDSLREQYGMTSLEFDGLLSECNSELARRDARPRWHETQPSNSFDWTPGTLPNSKISQMRMHNSLPFHMLDAESLLDTGGPQGCSELPWWTLTNFV
eukprot:CAMPEP_0177769512 /NCGR_PEP_ID=MMETSP0491_2-20121128/10363_1 /TAXON_ID=63592 /ORGANISM="Tetraselmis chuii, Strain PLY429" /LENGTH=323 /DNA_ID=CAMNT_0019286529 /DNA_START=142 /DNA_END=1113 /DNA_ORIENTATION=-